MTLCKNFINVFAFAVELELLPHRSHQFLRAIFRFKNNMAESVPTSQQASKEAEMEIKEEKLDSTPIEHEVERQTPPESSVWKPDRHFYLAIISIGARTFLSGITATSFLVIIPVCLVPRS